MTIKIIIEIILGIILLGVGSSFWNCIKSPIFLKHSFYSRLVVEADICGYIPNVFGNLFPIKLKKILMYGEN